MEKNIFPHRPKPGAQMALAGLAASRAAAATRFADYRLRRAAQTLRRQDADLALFARYLEETGALTPTPLPLGEGLTRIPAPFPLGEGELPNKTALPRALLARCRELRKNATDAEALLWQFLRNHRLAGAKFRRQHPFKGYILDFYCVAARLAVELDGSGHLEAEQVRHDEERTRVLASHGIRVLRFWNHEVLSQTEDVLGVIFEALTPAPLPGGEGKTSPLTPLPKGAPLSTADGSPPPL